MKILPESELVINNDGSIFHLHLFPDDIADDIILVGDQNRVKLISSFFDKILVERQNREFVTHTGIYHGKKISVISTGIGTDNIDIVINELDALVNIDLKTRTIKEKKKSLNLVRIGTCGGLQAEIMAGDYIASAYSMGLDGLMNFYSDPNNLKEDAISRAFMKHSNWSNLLPYPYIFRASEDLLSKIGKDMHQGITVSANGFYGPQGRTLRMDLAFPELNQKITDFDYSGLKFMNFEMESSAIAGISKLLNHNGLTVCLVLANRVNNSMITDYQAKMKKLIETVLNNLIN